MKNQTLVWMSFMILFTACQGQKQAEQGQESLIDEGMFQHHYITQDLPGETDWGYGCPALADFDNDGDLDYAFSGEIQFYIDPDLKVVWSKVVRKRIHVQKGTGA